MYFSEKNGNLCIATFHNRYFYKLFKDPFILKAYSIDDVHANNRYSLDMVRISPPGVGVLEFGSQCGDSKNGKGL